MSGKNGRKKLSKTTRINYLTYGMVIFAFVMMQSMLAGGSVSSSVKGQLVPICAYIVMAVSLNLTVGILGELSLGHAGFMSVGAFAGVITVMSLNDSGMPKPVLLTLAMLIAFVCAGIAGILIGIPVLRLKGDYLAIVTLAFGEIIKNLITCLYVGKDVNGIHFGFLSSISNLNMGDGAKVIIDGPMGASGIPKISTFTMGFALVMVTLIVILNLVNSRSGRAIMALRDNRIAAESVGVFVTKYKLMAFVISAAFAGSAGALYAMNFSTIVATKFNFNTSILVLVFVVLGGLGKMYGSIIAATLLTVLPEMLREFNDYRMLVYALVLILVMLATNNPTINGFVDRAKASVKQKMKAARRAKAEGGRAS